MLSVSDLSAEQIETIKSWIADGDQMSDVQRRLKEEFGFNVTYMDTRFLSLDLGLEFLSEEEPEPKVEEQEKSLDEMTPDDLEFTPGLKPVSVTVDSVARPGAMVSGGVTFSDGERGMWMIDQNGRPSVDPDTAGYQPIEADMIEFQQKLREALEGHM